MNFIRIYSNLRQLLLLLEIFSDELLQQQKTPVQTFKWTYFGEGMSWISFFFSSIISEQSQFPFFKFILKYRRKIFFELQIRKAF